MLSIHRLQMHLPGAYAHRAPGISRALGEVLAETKVSDTKVSDTKMIARLSLDAVCISPHSTDRQVAEAIAGRILSSIRSL